MLEEDAKVYKTERDRVTMKHGVFCIARLVLDFLISKSLEYFAIVDQDTQLCLCRLSIDSVVH